MSPEEYAEAIQLYLEKHLSMPPREWPAVRRHIADTIREACQAAVKTNKVPAKTQSIWDAYANEYRKRYGVEPLDGAKVRSQMANLLKKVPATDAPKLAQFFVRHSDQFYVRNKHPFDFCLRDAQRLYVEMQTGEIATFDSAKAQEKYDATVRAAREAYARKHGR